MSTESHRPGLHDLCQSLRGQKGSEGVRRGQKRDQKRDQNRACVGFFEAEESQARNPNIAVRCAWQGNKARAETRPASTRRPVARARARVRQDQRIRFDWAPPEVRTREVRNFGLPGAPRDLRPSDLRPLCFRPGSSFDVFSLGVLVMKLLRGRSWTQARLQVLHEAGPAQPETGRGTLFFTRNMSLGVQICRVSRATRASRVLRVSIEPLQEVLNGPDPVKRLASLAREVQDLRRVRKPQAGRACSFRGFDHAEGPAVSVRNLKPELFYRMLDHEDAGRRQAHAVRTQPLLLRVA